MKIIVNPQAGHGRAKSRLDQLKAELRIRGLTGEILLTERAGHATSLARDLVDGGCSRVVVMGGDGTITEVANGMLHKPAELGVIAVGTGNDLARSLHLPMNDLGRSLDLLQTGMARAVDVGEEGGRYFLSVLGIGYPALVAEETNRMQWLKGPPSFFLAVYKALSRMKVVPVRVELDDRVLEVGCTSILIHNTPYTGGGLKMAPDALMDDGLFDVVIIDSVGKLDLMWNFPKVYSGRHLDHPRFSVFRSSSVRVTSEEDLRKMRDGDPAGVLPVEARVVSRALRVVLPVE